MKIVNSFNRFCVKAQFYTVRALKSNVRRESANEQQMSLPASIFVSECYSLHKRSPHRYANFGIVFAHLLLLLISTMRQIDRNFDGIILSEFG